MKITFANPEMKEDMTGAAVVLATLQMAAQLKLPVNLIGVVGLVENMPSGTAMRPSDVVSSMSGQTIEVQNAGPLSKLFKISFGVRRSGARMLTYI